MKKYLFLSIMSVFLFSCNKVTEMNIIGEWKVVSYVENGVTYPETTTTIYHFKENGVLEVTVDGGSPTTSSYSVDEENQTITVNSSLWTVIEKKGESLKIQYTVGAYTIQLNMEKQ